MSFYCLLFLFQFLQRVHFLLFEEFVDAAKVVFFRPDGKFDDTLTDTCLASVLHGLSHAVIPGFYGANPDGTVRTFSRGGSDVTGSIVAMPSIATMSSAA